MFLSNYSDEFVKTLCENYILQGPLGDVST